MEEFRDVLIEHRGFYRGTPAILWYDGSPPQSFLHLGTIPPSEDEELFDAHSAHGGHWSDYMIRPVLWELGGARKELTKPAKASETGEDVADLVSGSMTDKVFWSIIGLLNWEAENDSEEVVEPVVVYLTFLSTKKIAGFQNQLCKKLYELDREVFAREMGDYAYGKPHFSPDHFLDVRCAVVANGKSFYDRVLSQPSEMPKLVEFEMLLTVAGEAYKRKTGRIASFVVDCDCETFSNKRGWAEK